MKKKQIRLRKFYLVHDGPAGGRCDARSKPLFASRRPKTSRLRCPYDTKRKTLYRRAERVDIW